jgi:hypothetical protein
VLGWRGVILGLARAVAGIVSGIAPESTHA